VNLARIKREHLLLLALAAAPAVVVQGLRLTDLTSPRVASATGATPVVAAADSPVGAPSAAQKQAALWIASMDDKPLRDPFIAPATPEPSDDSNTTQVVTAPDQTGPIATSRVPQFRLTGVIERGQKPLAAINGKVYRVGEEVAPGWTLTSVHGGERSVEIRHADGRLVTVRVQPVEVPR
jgi:hypothetical protein